MSVASGLHDELPNFPGVRERWGMEVPHRTPRSVWSAANRLFSVHRTSLIRQWSDEVTFFPNRIELTSEERPRITCREIRTVEGAVSRIAVQDNRVSGVEVESSEIIARATVFIGPRFLPQDELLFDIGCSTGLDGWIFVDPTGRTSVDGVWAAGNVVDSPAQLIDAAAAGSEAAIALNHHLLEADIHGAVAGAKQVSSSGTCTGPHL